MDSNFLQSVLGQRVPQGPVSQLPLFQRADSSVPPGMAPEPPPTSGLSGGYPGQPAAIPDFTQRPPAQVTQLPVETPQTFAGNPLDQWRAAAGKASMFAAPEQPSYGPALDQWRVAHGKAVGPQAGASAAPATNGDVLSQLPALVGNAAPQGVSQPAPQEAAPAQTHTHSGALSHEFLNTLPKSQAEMIRSAGGITMGHLMQLLTANAHLNDPAAQGKQRYMEHVDSLSQLQQQYPGIGLDQNGQIVLPQGVLALKNAAGGQDTEAIARIKAAFAYHNSGVSMYAPFINQLTALPGMVQR